jgi:hypothetical protein
MRAFNRAFAILVAMLWIAAGAGILYLVWSPEDGINMDKSRMTAMLSFSLSNSDQILATIILVAVMLPALALLLFEMKPSRRREMVDSRVPASDDRYRELHQRIDELQRRVDDKAPAERRAMSRGEPAAVSEGGYYEPPKRRWSLLNRHRG